METQTWLSSHYTFISAENISKVTVWSGDFLRAFLEVAEQQMRSYSSYVEKKSLKFIGEGWGGQNIRC